MLLEFVFGKHLKACLFRAFSEKRDTSHSVWSFFPLTPPPPVFESLSGCMYYLLDMIFHFLCSFLVWQGLSGTLYLLYVCVLLCLCTCMYIHVYIYIMHVYITICMCVYIYIYIYIYICSLWVAKGWT